MYNSVFVNKFTVQIGNLLKIKYMKIMCRFTLLSNTVLSHVRKIKKICYFYFQISFPSIWFDYLSILFIAIHVYVTIN